MTNKYIIANDLALLSTNELIELLQQELARRIKQDKLELDILQKFKSEAKYKFHTCADHCKNYKGPGCKCVKGVEK